MIYVWKKKRAGIENVEIVIMLGLPFLHDYRLC